MDFSGQLDDLQQRAAKAKQAAQAAATESRDQLRQRIDQAKVDVNLATKDARQQGDAAAADTRSKWAQLKADAAAKTDDLQARIDKRAGQIDANMAADDASWAEDDAADAIDYAAWTVDNAPAGRAGRHRRPRPRRRVGRQGVGLLAAATVRPRVASGQLGDPEQFLEELFGARHGLLACPTWRQR
jgi:hypothetical protein